MNEFTDKNEQAFLDACGAIGVEPGWKLKSCITLTQRRYGHPEGVNLTTLMPGSHDPGAAAPHRDRYGHVEGNDPRKKSRRRSHRGTLGERQGFWLPGSAPDSPESAAG